MGEDYCCENCSELMKVSQKAAWWVPEKVWSWDERLAFHQVNHSVNDSVTRKGRLMV